MNKDTILKSDIKEIIRALRKDMSKELDASIEKVEELQDASDFDGAIKEASRAKGFVKGMKWAIKNFEINL